MQSLIKTLNEYGLKIEFPKEKKQKEKIKNALKAEGNRGTTETFAFLVLLGIKITIKDREVVEEKFNFPEGVRTLPDVCLNHLRINVTMKNNSRGHQYPLNIFFESGISEEELSMRIQEDIAKNPVIYGLNEVEYKLKGMFTKDEKMSDAKNIVLANYYWHTAGNLNKTDTKKFGEKIQKQINEKGIIIEEIVEELEK